MYDILLEIPFKMNMLSHASRLTVTYTSTTSYSPSVWAPGTRQITFEIPSMEAWQLIIS